MQASTAVDHHRHHDLLNEQIHQRKHYTAKSALAPSSSITVTSVSPHMDTEEEVQGEHQHRHHHHPAEEKHQNVSYHHDTSPKLDFHYHAPHDEQAPQQNDDRHDNIDENHHQVVNGDLAGQDDPRQHESPEHNHPYALHEDSHAPVASGSRAHDDEDRYDAQQGYPVHRESGGGDVAVAASLDAGASMEEDDDGGGYGSSATNGGGADAVGAASTSLSSSAAAASKKQKRLCRHPGCMRVIKSQGHCQRHGAKAKRCRVDGCDKQAQGTHDGMCKRHWKELNFPGASSDNTQHHHTTNRMKKRGDLDAATHPPAPEGESVYESVLPQSIAYRPGPLSAAAAATQQQQQAKLYHQPAAAAAAAAAFSIANPPFNPEGDGAAGPSDQSTSNKAGQNLKGKSNTKMINSKSSSSPSLSPFPLDKSNMMPLVAYLRAGASKPAAWHRNAERRSRGMFPVAANQPLEPWERQLALVEILLLSGGTPFASWADLAHAWGRENGFHMSLASAVCERRGDIERKRGADGVAASSGKYKNMTEAQRAAMRERIRAKRHKSSNKHKSVHLKEAPSAPHADGEFSNNDIKQEVAEQLAAGVFHPGGGCRETVVRLRAEESETITSAGVDRKLPAMGNVGYCEDGGDHTQVVDNRSQYGTQHGIDHTSDATHIQKYEGQYHRENHAALHSHDVSAHAVINHHQAVEPPAEEIVAPTEEIPLISEVT